MGAGSYGLMMSLTERAAGARAVDGARRGGWPHGEPPPEMKSEDMPFQHRTEFAPGRRRAEEIRQP